MIYNRVRGWTSGRRLPLENVIEYPPFPGHPSQRSKIPIKKQSSIRKRLSLGKCRSVPEAKHGVKSLFPYCGVDLLVVG